MVYAKLALIAICPVIASVLLSLFDKRKLPGKLHKRQKQVLTGLVFGALAIWGTEFGVPIDGAIINARDAAPLCAGLIFGAPAGIIAGIIGGVERWFAVLWGAGTYTKAACSIATICAGLFGALLRKWLFDDKRPAWYYGFATGLVMEVLHMLMIFFTNMNDVQTAFTFVKQCSLPMILTNASAVMLALLCVSLLDGKTLRHEIKTKRLAQSFSRWLFIVVVTAFCVTGAFTYALQTRFSKHSNETMLKLYINDLKADIETASDANLLKLARNVAAIINSSSTVNDELLSTISNQPGNDFSEINIIDENGVITHSTTEGFVGFDMSEGEQSSAFLALLSDCNEMVQKYQPITKNGVNMKYAGVVLSSGGFVQVGYNAERFQQDIDGQVIGAAKNRHVGSNGYLIIARTDRIIVSDSHGNEGLHLEKAGFRFDPNTTFEYMRFVNRIYDEDCYCMYALSEGYYIIAVEPLSEVMFSRDLSVYLTVFIEILVFAALFILIYFLIKKLVVDKIHKINGTLSEITSGNLNTSVNVRSNAEFVLLSNDINSTVTTLKSYIKEAAARLDKELEIAKVIQASSLPSDFPAFPERKDFEIFAAMYAAKEVGGDFYDFCLLDENKLLFLIADVSGKGITGAMFMMKAKSVIKSCAEKNFSTKDIFTKANNTLCEGNDAEMFVTCWLGIFDFELHTLLFSNAGHNAPLIRRKGGSFEYLKAQHDFILGGMEEIRYHQTELILCEGDTLFLYTDGVTEATNLNNELYGDNRLSSILNQFRNNTVEELCSAVKSDVDDFVGSASQFDDITMLALTIK